MMRILNLAYTCPWPPQSGNDQRVWHLCRMMGKKAEQTLMCRVLNPQEGGRFPRFQGEPVEVINLYLPRPGPLERGAKALRYLLGAYPVLAGGFDFHAFTAKLKQIVRSNHFDIIVLDGIWLGIYWPIIQKSDAIKVLNHFDIESLSMRRKSALYPPGWEKWLYGMDAGRMESLESRVMRSADLVWVTSELDRETILKDNPGLPVHVAPNGVDCEAISCFPPSTTREVLFVGSLDHFVNKDAVIYFANEVFPLLRRLVPDAAFRVVGRNPGAEIAALRGLSGVEITGPVDDPAPWYRRCAAAVVPIRAGGGTRLKILEAMAFGRPVISTAIGCEGIQALHGKHVLLADKPADMAEALHRVLTCPSVAAGLTVEARKLVEDRYSWGPIADGMHAVYESMCQRRAARRKGA